MILWVAMKAIRKAVIPAAGLGTRFLPATKSIPKEMLTVVDRPILLYIVEEAVRAGIEDIVLIAGRGKTEIEDFFDVSYELEDTLVRQGKTDLLERINYIKNLANIISIRQKQPLGLGHAILCGRPVVGDEPFAVLLGDEIMISSPSQPTVTEQLVNLARETHQSCVAVMEVAPSEVKKYGIIEVKPLSEKTYQVLSVVEKPEPAQAPSRLALPGRYVFDALIFDEIKNSQPGKNGEIQLTDAMTTLAQKKGIIATQFVAKRYDAGDRLGYLQANVELALEHPELGQDFREYLKQLAQRI